MTFRWTAQREDAAALVADGRLSDPVIAEQVGIGRTTLFRWKALPEFEARVAATVAEVRAATTAAGIVDRQNRIDALNDRWRRMAAVIEARAADPAHANAPGGDTGLLVRTFKIARSGDEAEILEEFAVDTGLLKEMREHERQAAQELGEWTERREVSGRDGGAIEFEETTFARLISDPDATRAISGLLASLAGESRGPGLPANQREVDAGGASPAAR